MMEIDVKKLVDLPHGQAEKALRKSGNWEKHEYTFRVWGSYTPEPESQTIKVMAVNLEAAETAAENACDFDEIDEIELMTSEGME